MEQAAQQQQQNIDNQELIYPFPAKSTADQVNIFVFLRLLS
jgi:hypothetical protein